MGVITLVGKTTAIGVLVFAVAISILPKVLYQDLPLGLSLDLPTNKDRTMIVTGANSGLGFATVQHFVHNPNLTIIMACRSMERCQEAQQRLLLDDTNTIKATLRPMLLDVSKKTSVEQFAQALQGQPIDILINNAGVAGSTAQVSYDTEDTHVETHMRVNHLGAVHLVHALWSNLLQASDHARIVAVSSLTAAPAANNPTLGWYRDDKPNNQKIKSILLYGRSKRANLMFAHELQMRYGGGNHKVSVVAAQPGFTHTDLCKNGCKEQTHPFLKYLAHSNLLTGTLKMTARDGALSQAYAAVLPVSAGGAYIGPALGLVGPPKIVGRLDGSWHHMSFTRDESRYLWDKSLQALGIREFGHSEETRTSQNVDQQPNTGEEEVDQPASTDRFSSSSSSSSEDNTVSDANDDIDSDEQLDEDFDDDDDDDAYMGGEKEGYYTAAVI